MFISRRIKAFNEQSRAALFRSFVKTLVVLSCLIFVHSYAFAQSGSSSEHWIGTWAAAPMAFLPSPQQAPGPGSVAPASFKNQTLRQIVHVSAGGQRVRVVFSNVFGTEPLVIGAAYVGLRQKGAAITPGSARPLTFGGSPSGTIPAGAVLFSDAADLALPVLSDLAIDLFLPGDTAVSASPQTAHSGARQTSYVSTDGNHAGAPDMPAATTTASWYFLSRVEVTTPDEGRSVVLFGDSITDGYNSTPDTNNRWPDALARRIGERAGKVDFGVLNLGIDGNQILNDGLGISALARLDRDALAQTGVAYVVLLEGINDVGYRQQQRATAPELIAGDLQIIARAHARGLKIYGGTLLPYEGTTFPGYWTPEGEATRQKLNDWIRTSHAFDGVIDFDAAMRDPNNPTKIIPKYDSGDHLHPNDDGYGFMANTVDLSLFQISPGKTPKTIQATSPSK